MAKLPTIEEMAQNVAEKALDEYEYNGKTLRQWIEIILATDTNVGTKLSTNLAEVGTDCISRQAVMDSINGIECTRQTTWYEFYQKVITAVGKLPPAEPERTCVNCGRTLNNGGWYADGGTRCPIEEHYALPKDGYCHLWEKRNVTDDDYPERRTDE